MTWVALLLLGVGLADLVRAGSSPSVRSSLSAGVGSALLVAVVAASAGLTQGPDLIALIAITVLVIAWELLAGGPPSTQRPWPALVVLTLGALAAVACSGWASDADGVLGDWLRSSDASPLRTVSPAHALLLAGCLLTQVVTGNTVVRLVLGATGTIGPTRTPEQTIKGGRLLGPLERLLIVGLGLAGQFGAVGVVIAAKGVLRFPELQGQARTARIDDLTEYFLVGSFLSWSFALGSVALASL